MRQVFIPYQQDLVSHYNLDSKEPCVLLNQRYVEWINSHVDMVATVINYDEKYLDYIKQCDDDIGVLLVGGDNVGQHPVRDAFELQLAKLCIDKEIPLFGICKGMQLINLAQGGTLCDCENHVVEEDLTKLAHNVVLGDYNVFRNYFFRDIIPVNSYHKQCLDVLGKKVRVCGLDADDAEIVECISIDDKPVCGVQWHPSRLIDHYVSKNLLELFYSLKNN